MKTKLALILLLSLFIFACNSNTAQKTNIQNVSYTRNANGGVISLNKNLFLDKVMNYVENPKEWKYRGDLPCIIDFYADWCAPCRITAPILEELSREYAGKVIFYKIDTQKERELAGVFGIQSLPTFLFCPVKGNPTMSSGIAQTPEQTKAMFKQMIDQYLINK
jgi:thioredoxin